MLPFCFIIIFHGRYFSLGFTSEPAFTCLKLTMETLEECVFSYLGFLSRFRGEQGKWGDHLYSSLPVPTTHKRSVIYLQLCMWDDYLVFLIALFVIIRLIWWFIVRWHSSNFVADKWWIWTLVPSITLELQTKRHYPYAQVTPKQCVNSV